MLSEEGIYNRHSRSPDVLLSGSEGSEAAKEQFFYRLRKWVLQHVTSGSKADQHEMIADTDWDVLVVLDACRLDTCRTVVDWPVARVTSPASCTPTWLELIEVEGLFADSHVLAGNPQYEKFEIAANAVENFWESHWIDSFGTVLPEPILDRASELLDEDATPIVVHLQQPHWPYVAKIGETWQLAYKNTGPWHTSDGTVTSTQDSMARGLLDVRRAWQAYQASVRSVWKTLVLYLDEWLGANRSVIVTADHGETFGRICDFTMYEHPCNCHISPLTAVPWIEFAPSENGSEHADATVRDRLQALGYTE